MNIVKYAALSILLFACVALGQTATQPQTWMTLVAGEDASIKVALPAGATIRWCDAATSNKCSPIEPIVAATTIAAFCPGYAACANADPTDGLNGTLKNLQILERPAIVQNVTVNGSPITVPSQPLPTYPPISFVQGQQYTFYLTNTTPLGGTLQGQLQIVDGTNIVTATCTYTATQAVAATPTVPASQRALITCIPTAPK